MKLKNIIYAGILSLTLNNCTKAIKYEGKIDDPQKWHVAQRLDCKISDIVVLKTYNFNDKLYSHKDYLKNILYTISLNHPQYKGIYEENKYNKKLNLPALDIIKKHSTELDTNYNNIIEKHEIKIDKPENILI